MSPKRQPPRRRASPEMPTVKIQSFFYRSRLKPLALLGHGGMGEVWKAFDSALERDVAVKLMHSDKLQCGTAKLQFLAEARAIARLKHPNIAQVHMLGEEDDGVFFVMEYIEGRTLREIIQKQGALSLEDAAAVTLQVADALGFALEHGIIHCDIKPGNLLVTGDLQVYVTDFGLARFADAGPKPGHGEVFGTPCYMAPEQLRGETADFRADMYALGVSLYQMLTGTLPDPTDWQGRSLETHEAYCLPSPGHLRRMLGSRASAIVLRLTDSDREKRYGCYNNLADDLVSMAPGIRRRVAGLRHVALKPGAGLSQRWLGRLLPARWADSLFAERVGRFIPLAAEAVVLAGIFVGVAWAATWLTANRGSVGQDQAPGHADAVSHMPGLGLPPPVTPLELVGREWSRPVPPAEK
jgi:predicted Ser/Thr protein kinase